ncbi:MAG: methyltransferase domain-containing protein [Psychromonas sp.]|nr:methyltransferase domain-containing protein [Psychromonas sp.]
MSHSPLINEFESLFNKQGKPILDLACGNGRNGLYLHNSGFPVEFADKNSEALSSIQTVHNLTASQCKNIDFETGEQVLNGNSYQAILVFRYLHRPLMSQIIEAVEPGGFVIYETFTTENRQFARPNRDDFLLQPSELKEIFGGWECMFYFEGIKHNPDRAIAQIVCRKPD